MFGCRHSDHRTEELVRTSPPQARLVREAGGKGCPVHWLPRAPYALCQGYLVIDR